MNLTIISYTKVLDRHYENIALKVSQLVLPPRSAFARFQKGAENFRLALRSPQLTTIGGKLEIEFLDLVGHGTSNKDFKLGDDFLIRDQKIESSFAQILNYYLSPKTQIRLLGCVTGTEIPGLEMLRAVSSALGNRVVFGTTNIVHADDFDINGLRSSYTSLTSSLDSEASPPPTKAALGSAA
ncbi:hypothetical protein ACLEPN_23335 [Myxococcus sp. 1LA]